MNDLLKSIGRKRLEEIAYGSVRQSAEEGAMLARFALEASAEPSLASRSAQLVKAGMPWRDVLRGYIAGQGEYFVTHGHVSLIVAAKEKHKEIQEALKVTVPVIYKVYVGAGLFPWIDGRERYYLPHASQACYETGAGKAINALVEIDEELQLQGWPRFCWAYLDVVPGMMICRSTNENITGHVVRWLPVRVEGMQ
ncbi:hypothetical protein [Rahnella sp. ChDrAdgB13]|uniref:hypothetical protein n=1 Tax=Rahnella sp. ChDrAdgB13 TaxID=1850581 RepID=UPI001AD858E9|nr:hypothetical protein [Rahnella sp. ChDrAdgB13]